MLSVGFITLKKRIEAQNEVANNSSYINYAFKGSYSYTSIIKFMVEVHMLDFISANAIIFIIITTIVIVIMFIIVINTINLVELNISQVFLY